MTRPYADAAELDPLQRWESAVDQAIREAQRRGDFDDLPGHGKPLHLEDNPFAGDWAMGFSVLKNAGMAPHWMELEAEIVAGLSELAEIRDRTARHLRSQLARAGPKEPDWKPDGHADGKRADRGRKFGWPLRPARSRLRSADATDRPSLVGLDVQRRRARRAYVERASRLDETIRQYNAALPQELRWRERPRPTLEQAARDFDAACPPVPDRATR